MKLPTRPCYSDRLLERLPMKPLLLICLTASLVTAPAAAPADALAAMLAALSPGTPFADVLKAHPDAVYSDAAKPEEKPVPDQPGGLLLHWEKDPLLGTACTGDLGFKDGKLYEYVLMWTGIPAPPDEARKRFYAAAVARHGAGFTREALRLNPDSPVETRVPVLCWEAEGVRTLAYYAPPAADTGKKTGALTYARFPADDETIRSMLAGAAPTEDERAKTWAEMDALLPAQKAE